MVHDDWLTKFNQYCFSLKLKCGGSKTKRWGSAMLPPFGGNTATVIHALQIQNLHLQVTSTNDNEIY